MRGCVTLRRQTLSILIAKSRTLCFYETMKMVSFICQPCQHPLFLLQKATKLLNTNTTHLMASLLRVVGFSKDKEQQELLETRAPHPLKMAEENFLYLMT